MRIILTVLVAVALISFSQQAMAQTATVDAATGNVTLTGTGVYIVVTFISAANNLIAGNGLTDAGDIYDIDLAPNSLSWLNWGGHPDPKNLGNILPAGLANASGLTFEFHSGFGTYQGTIAFVPVPEPGTLLLASMGLFGCVAVRRRRS